jgi:hypothetical protein
MSKVRDVFETLPSGAFEDSRKERFAEAVASGMPVSKASAHVEVRRETGYLWAKHPRMLSRIDVLRSNDLKYKQVSVSLVVTQLARNVELATEAGQFKASNEALAMLYKILKADKDVLRDAGVLVHEPVVRPALAAGKPATSVSSAVLEKLRARNGKPRTIDTNAVVVNIVREEETYPDKSAADMPGDG